MIITMVKRGRLALLPLAAGLCAAFPAQAAWDFTPAASTRLTWSDNVGRQPDARAESGAVLALEPSFLLTNHSQRFDFSLAYGLHLFKYAGGQPSNAQRHTQDLSGNLKSRLVDDLLFLDAQADVHQQAASAFGPLPTGGNDYLRDNQTEMRSYNISPYMVHTFGAFAQGVLRYAHNGVSSDNAGFRRSYGNTLSALLTSGPSFRRLGWDASLTRSVIDEQVRNSSGGNSDQTSSSRNANLGLHYAASPQLSVGVFGGYDSYDFSGLGGGRSGAAYGADVTWVPSARTSVKASAGHRFYGPSYTLALQHRSRGTVWDINYSDAVSTTRNQFVLPQTLDTAALLDNLFRSQISDPVARAAFVQAYIQAAGLPPSLANSINFLSNRYALQKQLNASMAWQLARTSSVLSVFKSRRTMLSSEEVDSDLLGNSLSTLNDNTEQQGAMASASYKLGPQTAATVVGSASNVKSLTTGRRNNHRDLRVSLTRQFGARMHGMLEARRTRGDYGVGQQYTENSVSVALSARF